MMYQEACWLRQRLSEIPSSDLSPILSIGSGNRDFRRRRQPWIDAQLYDPLDQQGVQVLHHELRVAPGVDIAGDLEDERFRSELMQLGVRSVLCCNVLEHVLDPASLVAAVEQLVPSGGIIGVTVPRSYPYHPDPIDTMLRPDETSLTALFNRSHVIYSSTIRCDSLLGYLVRTPGRIDSVRNGRKAVRPTTLEAPVSLTTTLKQALVSTTVTAVVLRKL